MSLGPHLARLEAANLIQHLGLELADEYVFRHGLIQDAAYSSLLRQQRERWHRAAAEVLEAEYQSADGVVPTALAPILAHHYAIAGDAPRAIHYFTQAGEAAISAYANAEAAAHLGRALNLALEHPGFDSAALRRLASRVGRALELSAQLTAAIDHYVRMETVGQQRGDRALQLHALMARATVLSTASFVFDQAGAQAALERARLLARELDDHAAEAHINWTLLLRNTMTGGDPDERLALAEAALRSARALGLREQLAYILTDVWFAYAGLGRWDECQAALTEAEALWRSLHNPAMLCASLSRLGVCRLVAGDHQRALDQYAQSYAVAERMDSPHMRALCRAFSGISWIERGQFAAGLQVMQEVVALGSQSEDVTTMIGTQAELALAHGYLGDVDTGLSLAAQAIDTSRQRFPLLMPWAAGAAARLHAQRGDIAAAEALLAPAGYQEMSRRVGFMVAMWGGLGLARIEASLRSGDAARAAEQAAHFMERLAASKVVYLQVEAQSLRGRALLALGRQDEARAALKQARALAVRLGARRHLWTILVALAGLAEPDAARALRQAARAEVAWLAAQAPPALRASFLARPEVAALRSAEDGA